MGLFGRSNRGHEPQTAEKLYYIGMKLSLEEEKFEEAIPYFDRALAIQPNHILAWCLKGNALYNLDRHLDALQCYNKALGIDNRTDIAWQGAAFVAKAMGREEDELFAWRHFLACTTDDGPVKTFAIDRVQELQSQ